MNLINLSVSTNDKKYPVIIGKNLIRSFFTLLKKTQLI